MAATMQLSFEGFQDELSKARDKLKDVDENIKKLTGRDPTINRKRRGNENSSATVDKSKRRDTVFPRDRKNSTDDNNFANKRTASSRLGPRQDHQKRTRPNSDEEEEVYNKPAVQSSVVSSHNTALIKTRKDSLNELKSDTKIMARNRRMFGLLVGTLQKFQTEQSLQKDKEEKRAVIEEKLEKAAVKEKEEVLKEKRDLFSARRKNQALLRRLERKIEMTKRYEKWEKHQKYLLSFIKTKSTPSIMFIPAKSTPESEKLLQESAANIQESIENRRKRLEEKIKRLDEEDQDISNDRNGKIDDEIKIDDHVNNETVSDNPIEFPDSKNNEPEQQELEISLESDVIMIPIEDITKSNPVDLPSTDPDFEPLYD